MIPEVLRANQVADLTHGILHDSPTVRGFGAVATDVSHVKNGTLFFAADPEEILQALALGAYGIVCEEKNFSHILDFEVVWIVVKSMDDAKRRMIRYAILSMKVDVISLRDIELEIAKKLLVDPEVMIFYDDFDTLLCSLFGKNIRAILSQNTDFLSMEFPLITPEPPENAPFYVHASTIFDMQIFYDSSLYFLPLAPLFLQNLSTVVQIFIARQIKFSLAKFSSIDNISPIFVTQSLRLLNYGEGSCVLLPQKNEKLFEKFTKYIARHAKWGITATFVRRNFYENVAKKLDFTPQNLHFFDSDDECVQILKAKFFNFGCIGGMDFATLSRLIYLAAPKNHSLFDD